MGFTVTLGIILTSSVDLWITRLMGLLCVESSSVSSQKLSDAVIIVCSMI